MAGVNVTAGSNQGVHNVVYVCTEADDLYAIDADSGVVLWHDNFLTSNYAIAPGAVVTTVPSTDLGPTNIAPQRGITATPVIDPASGTLFIDGATKQVVNGTSNYLWQFHAINISSGTELAGSGSGVVIADTAWVGTNFTYVSGPTVNGKGDGSINGKLTFNAVRQQQRPGLTLDNGVVYIGYASNADNGPYHGWVLGFSEHSYQLVAAFCTTPNGGEGGIWQGGGQLVTDSAGDLYFMTGNGTFDTTLNALGFPI